MHCRVIHDIAVVSNLSRDFEVDRALRQPPIQLVEQIVRSLRRSHRSIQMLLPSLWNNCVTPIPAHAILIGKLHRSKPKILLLRKARRKRCNRLHKCQRLRMILHKGLYLRWIALRHAPQNSRNSCPVVAGNPLAECATMSVCTCSARLNRIAMPRGSAFGSLSGISGTPVPSENLTVTGVEPCTACCARVSDAAALDGVNVPVNKMPLAWTGLNPGCDPNMASNCFKISSLSAINFSSFGSGIVSLLLRA